MPTRADNKPPKQLAHRLGAHGIAARRVLLPEGHDPNSFFVEGGDARAVPVSGGGRAAMKFRVIRQKTPSGAHSPIQVVEQSTGQGVGWINRYLDREYVRRLAVTSLLQLRAQACCTSCAGGRAFITPARSPRRTSANRLCSITSVSSPAGNLRLLLPPSTNAWPMSIAPPQ